MAEADSSLENDLDPHVRFKAERALLEGQQAEQVRQRTKVAQRSAAEGLDKSADSHDRAALSYEQLAETGDDGASDHAARHREFAEEDRRIADQLRRMAEH